MDFSTSIPRGHIIFFASWTDFGIWFPSVSMSLSTSNRCLKLLLLQPWSSLSRRSFRSPKRWEYFWLSGQRGFFQSSMNYFSLANSEGVYTHWNSTSRNIWSTLCTHCNTSPSSKPLTSWSVISSGLNTFGGNNDSFPLKSQLSSRSSSWSVARTSPSFRQPASSSLRPSSPCLFQHV
jgi:hypothetical protein